MEKKQHAQFSKKVQPYRNFLNARRVQPVTGSCLCFWYMNVNFDLCFWYMNVNFDFMLLVHEC